MTQNCLAFFLYISHVTFHKLGCSRLSLKTFYLTGREISTVTSSTGLNDWVKWNIFIVLSSGTRVIVSKSISQTRVFVDIFWRNCQRYLADGWPLSTLLLNNLEFFYWMRIDCLSGGLFRNCLPKNLDPWATLQRRKDSGAELSDFDRNQDIFRGDSLALHATNIHSWKF